MQTGGLGTLRGCPSTREGDTLGYRISPPLVGGVDDEVGGGRGKESPRFVVAEGPVGGGELFGQGLSSLLWPVAGKIS